MRRHPRYPTSIDCLIRTARGVELSGTITDLSLGGAGIETLGDPAVRGPFELFVLHESMPFRTPCEARGIRDIWTRRVVHVEFGQMEPEARDNLEFLIQDLQEQAAQVSGAQHQPNVRGKVLALFQRRVRSG